MACIMSHMSATRQPSVHHPEASSGEDFRSRIARVRAGISVAEAVDLMTRWSIPVARFAAILGTSSRNWSRVRNNRNGAVLNAVESDRFSRVREVLEHALAVFDTDDQAVAWLSLPNRALSGEIPLALLDTDAGVRAVDAALTRLEYGVFA